MSKSTFSKGSSLARCYDRITKKGKAKGNSKYAPPSGAVTDVVEKIEAAQERSLPTSRDVPPNPTIQTECEPASADSLISSDVESQESQESLGTTSPMTPVDTKKLAAALTDPEELWVSFFSGVVLDDAYEAVEEGLSEKSLEFTHSTEVGKAVKRSTSRLGKVCNFPIKLILTPLERGRKMANTFAPLLEMRFGPLHASLQVGHVVLEWNDSSLVAPHLCTAEDQVMELDMQPHSKWVEYTAQQHLKMRKAAQDLNFPDQIELTYKVASEKKNLIDALIEVIIRYNKYYHYNLFDRNCQHFVMDALKALEVDVPRELPGGLGEYYKALVKGKTPSVPSKFKTHSDLDTYVLHKRSEGVIGSMPQHDLEFLLALYFRFHLESKAKLKKDAKALDTWECSEQQRCCMEEVENLIQKESMKIHEFGH